MIELSRHIESLLLKHDCVIVPGLGGFVTQYVPARRIADEQLFLPPFRSVGFNPELAINDGLLAQSYMHAYDTTYPESLKLIEDAVNELKEELTEKGEFTLHGIGRLTIGIDGRYNFQPNEAGVISPELYGLDSFIIPEMSQRQDEETTSEPLTAKEKIKRLKPTVKRTEKHYTISLNREMVNYVAAAVVALFFYFIWATPINNGTSMSERQNAAFINEQLFAPSSGTPKAQPVVFTQQKTEGAPMQATEKVSQEALCTEEENNPLGRGRYTIVLASAIPQANAKELTSRLKLKGMNEAMTYEKGRMVRVVYGNFANKSEAQQKLKELHAHADFAQAWVMEVQ